MRIVLSILFISGVPGFAQNESTWQIFDLEQLLKERTETSQAYLPFLDTSELRTGIYSLPAGGTDRQQPHNEDEIYYVISGNAILTIEDSDTSVKAGSIIFVPAGAAHHFHTIEEGLTLLVIFAN